VLARIVGLGHSLLQESETTPPTAGRVVFVYNPSDRSIAQPPVKVLEQNWKNQAEERVSDYTFPADWDLAHSFINPDQSDHHISEVFAKLLELASHD
jgi:hypothetical protein